MADFTALKTAIQNAIKQNGNEEITGNILQDVLLAIVSTLGDGSINDLITALGSEATTRSQADGTLQQNIDAEAQARQLADSTLQGGINTAMQAINAINNAIANGCVYAGIATPSSTPASGKVFYLALTAGTYTNYGGLEVPQGINILKNNGSTWSLDSFLGIDDAPIPSSNNLVKSGGVFNDIMTNGSAFDLSAYNNGTTYADLNAALTALNALPAAYKKGGMSMKYVQTSDNKYVQYRLMADEFSTTPSDWQGVDDEPTAGSDNLVKSGGVYQNFFKTNSFAYSKELEDNYAFNFDTSTLAVGSTISYTKTANTGYSCLKVKLSAGDTININSFGGNATRNYVITDNADKVLTFGEWGLANIEYTINVDGFAYINNNKSQLDNPNVIHFYYLQKHLDTIVYKNDIKEVFGNSKDKTLSQDFLKSEFDKVSYGDILLNENVTEAGILRNVAICKDRTYRYSIITNDTTTVYLDFRNEGTSPMQQQIIIANLKSSNFGYIVADRDYSSIRWIVDGSATIKIELVSDLSIKDSEIRNSNFANYLYNSKYIGGNNVSESIQGIIIEEKEYSENQGSDTEHHSYEKNVGKVIASYASDKDWCVENGRNSSLAIFNLRNSLNRENINFLTLNSTIIIDGDEYILGSYLSDIALFNVSDNEFFAQVRCVVYRDEVLPENEVSRNIGVFINKSDYSINRIKFISVVDNIEGNEVVGWNADEIVKYNDVYYSPWYCSENAESAKYNENAPEGSYIIKSYDLVNWTIETLIIERPSIGDPGGSTAETSIYLTNGVIYFAVRWPYGNNPVCGTYDIANGTLSLNRINAFNIGAARPSLVVFNGNIYYYNISNVNTIINGINVARCEPVLIKMDMNWNVVGYVHRKTSISCSYSKLYAYKSHLLIFMGCNFSGVGTTHPWAQAINRCGIYYNDITDIALNM